MGHETLIKQIRISSLWNQEGRRIRLTKIYWARAINAKKSPRKKLSHPHPIGWTLYVWGYDLHTKNKSEFRYPWAYHRIDRRTYYIRMSLGHDPFHPANQALKSLI